MNDTQGHAFRFFEGESYNKLFEIFQPVENFNEWRLLYFISFLLLVGFFVLNMFVGVVVENFHRCREEQEKEERAARAIKRARKLDKRRRSTRFLNLWHILYLKWT